MEFTRTSPCAREGGARGRLQKVTERLIQPHRLRSQSGQGLDRCCVIADIASPRMKCISVSSLVPCLGLRTHKYRQAYAPQWEILRSPRRLGSRTVQDLLEPFWRQG